MFPHHGGSSTTPIPPGPVKTLSDEDAMRQVVDPAKTIVKVAALQDVSDGFGFEACNDQGQPPYRGRLEMGFRIPDDTEPTKYFERIAQTMVQQGVAGTKSAAGQEPVRHRHPRFAVIGQNPVAREDGYVHVLVSAATWPTTATAPA